MHIMQGPGVPIDILDYLHLIVLQPTDNGSAFFSSIRATDFHPPLDHVLVTPSV